MENIHKMCADIKLNTTYTCHECGKSDIGSTVHMRIICTSSDELKNDLDNTLESSHNMPIAWSCFRGNKKDLFLCEECTKVDQRIIDTYHHQN